MKLDANEKMLLALEQAMEGALCGEVPIGAVITDGFGNIVAEFHNQVEELSDPTAHAEMLAIRAASQLNKNNNRLEDHTIYVTLEPCAMCAAAISHARIKKLVYAAADEKGGGVEHGARVFTHTTTLHKPEVVSGIMAEEAKNLLKNFFEALRNKN